MLKHKPILIKAIQEEQADKERQEQERIKSLERAKKEQELKDKQEQDRRLKESQLEEKRQAQEQQVSEKKGRDSPYTEKGQAPVKAARSTNPVKAVFDFIFRVLTLIVNLIISFLESIQWIVVSVVLTIAGIVILKYAGINVGDLIDKAIELFKK